MVEVKDAAMTTDPEPFVIYKDMGTSMETDTVTVDASMTTDPEPVVVSKDMGTSMETETVTVDGTGQTLVQTDPEPVVVSKDMDTSMDTDSAALSPITVETPCHTDAAAEEDTSSLQPESDFWDDGWLTTQHDPTPASQDSPKDDSPSSSGDALLDSSGEGEDVDDQILIQVSIKTYV